MASPSRASRRARVHRESRRALSEEHVAELAAVAGGARCAFCATAPDRRDLDVALVVAGIGDLRVRALVVGVVLRRALALDGLLARRADRLARVGIAGWRPAAAGSRLSITVGAAGVGPST